MKRKMKRYAEGSEDAVGFEDVGTPDISAPEDKVSEDDLSFKDIFAMKRKSGAKDFTWRGKKYTTEVAGAKKPKEEVTEEVTVSTPRLPKRVANLAPRGSNAPAPSSYTPKAFEGARQLRDIASNIGEKFSRANEAARAKKPDTGKYQPKAFEGARQLADFLERDRKEKAERNRRLSMTKSEGMKKGGSVSSASRRADGIAQRGKTRGRMV